MCFMVLYMIYQMFGWFPDTLKKYNEKTRYKLKMSEYRGEQAEMNIQRLNVRIDQVLTITMRISDDNCDGVCDA